MDKQDEILNIGCGNSRLSEEMYEDDYHKITNIDFSNKVISQMEDRLKSKCPDMKFKVMDVLEMKEFENGKFNTILDKATLDSVLCGDNSVPNAAKMMKEVFRILAPGGHYMVISYGDPLHREKYLNTEKWEIKIDKIAKPSANVAPNLNVDENDVKNFHYIYTMTKPK
ncbi:MAG: class I SAM-dependent methyltransferase [archaeon]|nr:class I SAM-dependent methyltransferase [archaeon]